MNFRILSKFKPAGDQPKAINGLSTGLKKGHKFQTLLGVTGSGKTFTMSKIIEKTQLPTLVISPNKTLAAQLYEEFRAFFPKNNVCYFVSYYDYYQPESYIPQTDTYIEKDAKINEEIDRLRHESVQSLLSGGKTIVVASVSCIYNLGSPINYQKISLILKRGQLVKTDQLISRLLDLQYERDDYQLWRGKFRKRINFIDVWPPGKDQIIRIEIEKEKIKSMFVGEIPFGKFKPVAKMEIWPAKFWPAEKSGINAALSNIKIELENQYLKLKKAGKIIEAERIKRRTDYDLAMIKETGWCPGIENYSRHLELRKKGEAPFTLIDYFRRPGGRKERKFLIFIDESHITMPQIRGMYFGDKSRKETLIQYGFRLPSAIDNRPLSFDEFLRRINKAIFVSATPSFFEKKHSAQIIEQIIRPTHLLDPSIEIRPTKNQIEDLLKEIDLRKQKKERVLVLTITKRLAEAISDYLKKKSIRANYLHSEIKTLSRPKILTDLRKGRFDALVGINLLREGLDLPEVSLTAILDADKEGFLRDETSLIQIIGRTSRHSEGHVIMYADKVTSSMKRAILETNRRRKAQKSYNEKNNLKPRAIVKEIKDTLSLLSPDEREKKLPKEEFKKEYLRQLKYQLDLARRNLQFEKASKIKGEINKIEAP